MLKRFKDLQETLTSPEAKELYFNAAVAVAIGVTVVVLVNVIESIGNSTEARRLHNKFVVATGNGVLYPTFQYMDGEDLVSQYN